jgi:hypothetical protein
VARAPPQGHREVAQDDRAVENHPDEAAAAPASPARLAAGNRDLPDGLLESSP